MSVTAALVTAVPASGLAQLDPFSLRTTPYGSPLGDNQSDRQDGQRDGQGGDRADPYQLQPTERVGPTQIEDTASSSAADRDRDRDQDRDEDDQAINGRGNGRGDTRRDARTGRTASALVRPAPPNEFEQLVQQRVGRRLPRFGASFIVPGDRDFATRTATTVPPSYVLNPGDRVFIGLSGSIEGSVEREIDSNGRIFLPRVGQINLAGLTYGDLKTAVERAVGVRYRNFNAAVAVTRLRGIRVYVTGFANNPGSYTVNSLSTLVNAVFAAGGPSSGGSFRSVRLYRNGELISDFDLYDFVRGGDRSRDVVLQNQDVISIAPLGPQVALTGSVNDEAIYESKPGESVADLLRFAGGANALADQSRVVVYRLAEAASGGAQVSRDQLASTRIAGGDIVQVLNTGSLAQPQGGQAVLVRIDGEVASPGNYYVAPNTSLDEVVRQAGGLTPRAFAFGTQFRRVTVRQQQRESFDEAIRQLELTLTGAALTSDNTIDAGTRAAQLASARAVLDRLRNTEPDGRIVLPIEAGATALPTQLSLQNNDTIYVPPRPTTVGVFGSVYRPASFLIQDERPRKVREYLKMAGGPLRLADKRDIFVVRANGAVLSRRNGGLNAYVLPGDVVFVPVKTQNTSFLARLGQISSILFQAGITAAAVIAVTN